LPLMGLRWKPELIENGLPMLSFHVWHRIQRKAQADPAISGHFVNLLCRLRLLALGFSIRRQDDSGVKFTYLLLSYLHNNSSGCIDADKKPWLSLEVRGQIDLFIRVAYDDIWPNTKTASSHLIGRKSDLVARSPLRNSSSFRCGASFLWVSCFLFIGCSANWNHSYQVAQPFPAQSPFVWSLPAPYVTHCK
jgi:hypothetical protein